MENGIFWSEIGLGFGEPGGTPLTENSEEYPPPHPLPGQQTTIRPQITNKKGIEQVHFVINLN